MERKESVSYYWGVAIGKSKLHYSCGRMSCASFVIDVDTINTRPKNSTHVKGRFIVVSNTTPHVKDPIQGVIKPCQSNDIYCSNEKQHV